MKTNPNDTISQMTMEAYQLSGQIGLTKREYFAAMAMQGIMANPGRCLTATPWAELSVELADALINELNEPK